MFFVIGVCLFLIIANYCVSVSDERMIDTRTTASDMQYGRMAYNGGMVVPPMTPNVFYQVRIIYILRRF